VAGLSLLLAHVLCVKNEGLRFSSDLSAELMEESDLWKYEYKDLVFQYLIRKQNFPFQWKGSESSKPKENSNIRIKGPTILICSFDILGIIHYEFVPQGWST
jgi:hypothetical protein